jgi:D-amino-acid oxidase
MARHLPWLLDRLGDRGIRLRLAQVDDLEAAAPPADVVVNCAGLGARDVAGHGGPSGARAGGRRGADRG